MTTRRRCGPEVSSDYQPIPLLSRNPPEMEPVDAKARDWISLHLFYRDFTAHDDLLVNLWAPLVEDLSTADLITMHFFVRYLEGGPHLRLRVLPRASDDRRDIQERITSALADYVARVPSRPSADLTVWNSRGATLREDNTIEVAEYEPEVERYAGPEGVRIAEDHFLDSANVTLQALVRAASHPDPAATKFGYALQLASVLALSAGFKKFLIHRFWEDYDRHLFDEREPVEETQAYFRLLRDNRDVLREQFSAMARVEVDWQLVNDGLVSTFGNAVKTTAERLTYAIEAEPDRYKEEFREFRMRRKYVLVFQSYIHMLLNRMGYWGRREEIIARLSADVWRDVLLHEAEVL